MTTGPRRASPAGLLLATTAPPSDRESAAPAAVRASGLTRDYGGTGLFDVSLSVPTGSIYGLVGPNGAGKTTLLSILTGTRHADRGQVEFAVDRRRVAVCPDVPEFDGWLTAFEVVDLARALIAPQLDGDAVAQALATAGLAEAADRRVGGFSRGMTQRLGVATALVGEPELLILDEPTSALDPAGRADLLALVAGMRGRATVIFSSHILADVQRVADRIGILRAGCLVYEGATRALIDTYLQPRWHVRIVGDAGPLAAELARRPWVGQVLPRDDGLIVEATSLEAGERGIPAALAAVDARLVACEPVAADLETAFLAVTSRKPR